MSFPLGSIYASPGALAAFGEARIRECLVRHARGDWGDINPGDKGCNEQALTDGSRLLSVYRLDGNVLWVITEADRSATTALTPEEY